MMDPPATIKFKAPKAYRLMMNVSPSEILGRFFVLQSELIRTVQDIDGVDPECWHLLGYNEKLGPGLRRGDESPNDRLVVYSRLVPPGTKFAEPSIGRVITATAVRRTGMGRELMRESLRRAEKLWPNRAIRIGAQRQLERFYMDFGFVTASEPYDEDGILHIEMLRPASTIADRSAHLAGQK